MTSAPKSYDEIIGLTLALAFHGALVVLIGQSLSRSAPPPLPRAVHVSLAEDVGLVSQSSVPPSEAQASTAPEIGEDPALPTEAPKPVETVKPTPQVHPAPKPSAPKSSAKTPTQPPAKSPAKTPTQAPAKTPAKTPAKAPASTNTPAKPKGGKQIDADFLKGLGSSSNANASSTASSAPFGAREQAALNSAINRALKPVWRAPQGVDSERLVTILSWRLNPDGTLAGKPVVVRQEGITDSNRAQAPVHAQNAIRAVQLAAPFRLPDQFYEQWRFVKDWRFDRRL